MKLYIYQKQVYGSTLYYFAENNDPKQIRALKNLLGTKTISVRQMLDLRTLGFEIVEVINPENALHSRLSSYAI